LQRRRRGRNHRFTIHHDLVKAVIARVREVMLSDESVATGRAISDRL
jgi:hypothetical protein